MDQHVAWNLQARGDGITAAMQVQDPPAAPSEKAWLQDTARGAYEDAAHLTEQPKGWRA